MAIRYYNIKSGEELVADDEPKIAALWSVSDHSPNITQGQDMGWRLAPEVVVEMNAILSDPARIQEIANRYRLMYEDVNEPIVLTWISDRTDVNSAPVADDTDYADAYNEKVRELEKQRREEAEVGKQVQTTTNTTTESLEDMEKRAALAERIAKANAAASNTTSTTNKK